MWDGSRHGSQAGTGAIIRQQPTDGRDDRAHNLTMRFWGGPSDGGKNGLSTGAVALGLVAVLAACHLTGCAISSAENRLRPELAVKKDFRQALLEQYKDLNSIMGFYQTGAWTYRGATNIELASVVTDKTERRNSIAYDLIFLINEFYDAYELSWFATVQTGNVVADLLSLGTSTAGAVAGGEGVKTMLAAITAGVIGGKRSFDKHVLADQSINLIIYNMRKGRQEKLRNIRNALAEKDDGKYPIQEVLIDLQEFYYAGTVLGAVQSILGQDVDSMKTGQANQAALDRERLEEALAILSAAKTEESKRAAVSAAILWISRVQTNWARAMLEADADFRTQDAETHLKAVKERATLSEKLGRAEYSASRFAADEPQIAGGVVYQSVGTTVMIGGTNVSEKIRLKLQRDGDWKVVGYAFSLPKAGSGGGS